MPRPKDYPENSQDSQPVEDGFGGPNLDFLLKATAESSPNGVIIVDDMGIVVWANHSLCDIFGYERGELHGKCLEILLPGHLRANHVKLRSVFVAAL